MSENPLISIIIPCYNVARFVTKAIDSALIQDVNKEIIIIDDGSTDDLCEVISKYNNIIYHYQPNRGLSGARNTGIRLSKGEYISFLDADDWYLPNGLMYNLEAFKENPDSGMVVGTHYGTKDGSIEGVKPNFLDATITYKNLIAKNTIGMISTVLFRTEVVKQFYFNEEIKYGEDMDLFYKIAKSYSIYHHNNPIAVYYYHSNNMSHNADKMLLSLLKILDDQKPFLNGKKDLEMLEDSKMRLIKYYSEKLYYLLRGLLQDNSKAERSKEGLLTLKMYAPRLFYQLRDHKYLEFKNLIEYLKVNNGSQSDIDVLTDREKNRKIRLIRKKLSKIKNLFFKTDGF